MSLKIRVRPRLGKEDSCTMSFTCDGAEGLDGWSIEVTHNSDETLSIAVTMNIVEAEGVLSCSYDLEGTWYSE